MFFVSNLLSSSQAGRPEVRIPPKALDAPDHLTKHFSQWATVVFGCLRRWRFEKCGSKLVNI